MTPLKIVVVVVVLIKYRCLVGSVCLFIYVGPDTPLLITRGSSASPDTIKNCYRFYGAV